MRMVEKTGATVMVHDYRRPPEHPYPAAIDDVFACYVWLLQSGVPAACLTIAGDSAGGGMVISLMAAIKEKGLPMPAGGVLLSPWVDLADVTSPSWGENWPANDYLPPRLATLFAKAYAGRKSLSDPKVSPTNEDLTGFPPLLVIVGEFECLRDQIVAFAAKARAAGVEVELEVSAGMVHVFPLFAPLCEDSDPPVKDPRSAMSP